jgi:hypothetical protein
MCCLPFYNGLPTIPRYKTKLGMHFPHDKLQCLILHKHPINISYPRVQPPWLSPNATTINRSGNGTGLFSAVGFQGRRNKGCKDASPARLSKQLPRELVALTRPRISQANRDIYCHDQRFWFLKN